ncbi:hypothetical protein O0L34_g739 [Tuta absoluta]|nr:hypothetical protein O0L34_g739 [Tuta absoluta]
MPPRTRTTKSTKALKENIGISSKLKLKAADKVLKPPRKVLGDKTNSASDDNASIDIPNKASKTLISDIKLTKIIQNNDITAKARRERRIPSRFADYNILKTKRILPESDSSNDKNGKKNVVNVTITDTKSSTKDDSSNVSPFKTPQKVPEASLVASRPRRVSRLPSRFEDHSMSPSKFIPVQPCHASTPIAPKIPKTQETVKTTSKNDTNSNQYNTSTPKNVTSNGKISKVASDSNNNAKGRTLRTRKAVINEEKAPTRSKKFPAKSDISRIEKQKAKKLASPLKEKVVGKKVATSAKKLVTPQKAILVQSKIVSPTKKISSRTQKSPVKLPSPLKHSYLKTLNNSSSFVVETVRSPVKPSSPVKRPNLRAIKDLSFKVLEENKKKECAQDVYEFTFDPTEEPAPQKKKRKVAKRKPAKSKPKTVTFKNNYDQNVNKALAALKNAVTKKAPQNADINVKKTISAETNKIATPSNGLNTNGDIITSPQVQRNVASKIIIGNTKQTTTNNVQNIPQIQKNIAYNPHKVHKNVPLPAAPNREPDESMPLSEPNQSRTTFPQPNQSVRVEDIAADFDTSPQHDIDYSPVNSPIRPKTPVNQISRISDIHHHNDPLNLRENISFDPNPIASSSMNTSVRHPQPSPWRAEFESLPIRWHVNSYVKPNMTPAVECSFINFDDKNKKKHVYTNMLPQNENLPEIVQKDQPNVIQSSIISFFKEVVDKSSSKKKRGRSVTPVTASLFIETAEANKGDDKAKQSTRQLFTPKKNDKARSDTSNQDSSKDASTDKENSKDSSKGRKRKNNEEANGATPAKTRKEKDDKYFGFDDSENLENVSPTKEVGRKKSLRQARARAALREHNAQPAPTRAVIPVAVKTARMAEVERLYDEMKSASDAPEIPAQEPTTANVEPIEELNEDTQTSVHLFEDVEDIVHHLKPQRKSYGKAKKVTFMRKGSSDTQDSDLRPEPTSDDEEDLHDLTFDPGLPLLNEDKKRTKKKSSKKQKMTKKEEEEAEAWAAGFNSMCEDVEEFPLLVE